MNSQKSHNHKTKNNKPATAQTPHPQKLSQDDLLSIIESILFAASRSLSIQDLSRLLHTEQISTLEIKKTLSLLVEKYNSPACGIELSTAAGGWQLKTKEENKDYIRRLIKGKLFQLSAPAMEVLSIVAYHQPYRKIDIDDARGVESGHLLKTLMEKNLVCFGPKSQLPGRSITYKTTSRFLEVFGLKSLKELPSAEDIMDLIPDSSHASPPISDVQKTLLASKTTKDFKAEQQTITKELDSVSEKIRSVRIKSTMQEH